MVDVLPLLSVLGGLIAVMWMLIGRVGPFRPARALLAMRSLQGENLAMVVATISIALSAGEAKAVFVALGSDPPDVYWLFGAVAVIAVVGMAIAPRLALALVALPALVLQLAGLALGGEPVLAAVLLFAAIALLAVLAVVRGFT